MCQQFNCVSRYQSRMLSFMPYHWFIHWMQTLPLTTCYCMCRGGSALFGQLVGQGQCHQPQLLPQHSTWDSHGATSCNHCFWHWTRHCSIVSHGDFTVQVQSVVCSLFSASNRLCLLRRRYMTVLMSESKSPWPACEHCMLHQLVTLTVAMFMQ